ncbi:LysR family transcriptional regulator [Shewanella sp. NFH-SH190041]|uniref:LysR family transcriptional regulator n=1 Tax=Shewanella sp. NFH-SH190041 TaxID=2950245 RepID=UPI0021C26877|nr:LysR family transcriptional regulator [Shewanella sp. NFH-SH190041]BDM63121.1 LysR family transcriptional regulator [Shewanella sp. NFH-SH190041]
MKLSQIAMFVQACQLGSISQAAARLGKSRTTVSTALGALENQLNAKLLIRSGNHIEPTALGESVLADFERMLQLNEQIEQKCSQAQLGVESRLLVARDDALPEEFWRRLIPAFRHRFTATNLSLYVAPTQELEDMVEKGFVDAAFGLFPRQTSVSRCHFAHLGQLRMMAVAHHSHALTRLAKVNHDDLQQYTQITLAYLDDESLKPVEQISPHYMALPFYEFLRDAVQDALGWAYIPALLIQPDLRNGVIRVLKNKTAMNWHPYGLITCAEHPAGPAVNWLAEQIENYLITHSV